MVTVPRHRTAPKRAQLSRPVACAIKAGLLTYNRTIFDYGCGYGSDAAFLAEQGYPVVGKYDPHYFPDEPIIPADIVLLLFVLTVIEDPAERETVLVRAYQLARQYLLVGFVTGGKTKGNPFNDGLLSPYTGTFAKFYTASEAVAFLRTVLNTEPIRLYEGVYALAKQPIQPNRAYQTPLAELRRIRKNLQGEKYRLLKQGPLAPPGAYIEPYTTTASTKTYYRLRSKRCNLQGKNGPCGSLHLGSQNSPRYLEASAAIHRRERLSLIQDKLDYTKEVLINSKVKIQNEAT